MEDIDSIVLTEVSAEFSKSDHLPEDVYDVEISNIKKVDGQNYNTKEPEVHIEFEFTVLGDLAGAKFYRTVTPKLSRGDNPSNLWRIISSTLGEETDTKDFHVSSLKGKQLRVTVKDKTSKKGDVYSTVVDFLKSRVDTKKK